MGERAVVNTSPLILLSHAGLLDFLKLAGEPIAVPSAVAIEVRKRGSSDPAVAALPSTTWLVEVPPKPEVPSVLAWDLGPGETSVLCYALANPGCEAVLDDSAARRCAAAHNLKKVGCVGLVVRAKRRGLIAKARPSIEALVSAGLYLSDRTLAEVLRLVGE